MGQVLLIYMPAAAAAAAAAAKDSNDCWLVVQLALLLGQGTPSNYYHPRPCDHLSLSSKCTVLTQFMQNIRMSAKTSILVS
jgi:hypothetical protein